MAISFQDHLRALRHPAAPSISTRKVLNSVLVFSEIIGSAGHGLAEPLPYDDAYLVSVRLVEGKHARVFYEGKEQKRYDLRRGVMHIHDLRRQPQVEVWDPFHMLNAYMPRSFLVAFSEQHGRTFRDFPTGSHASAIDTAVEWLLRSIQPALVRPHEANSLFLDHVAMALASHLLATYGCFVSFGDLVGPGGFSRQQLQKCLDMIEDYLDTDLTLASLAQEFNLSSRHFTRLFVRSMGQPPYRYLLSRRIARAKALLKEQRLSLSDVAHMCGFADQSHFTRVFSCATGMSPGAFQKQKEVRRLFPNRKFIPHLPV